MGAVFTTLNGPWRWGSLLVIPLLAIFTIFLLVNLENRLLRRSLRFAIVSSLALNLLILVFASINNAFQNPFWQNQSQVAQLRINPINVRDQQVPFVWQETNDRPTPEPKIETERLTKPSTILQTKPLSFDETKPDIDTQLVRRTIAATSILPHNPMVYHLHRQFPALQPQSTNLLLGEDIAEKKSSVPSRTNQSETAAEAVLGNISTATTRNQVRPLIGPKRPESTATLPDSYDFDTNLQKPAVVNNLTVVKKPVIAPPGSIGKALDADTIEKALRKRQRDSRLPSELYFEPVAVRPDIARTVKPAAPTMTPPSVLPLKSVKPELTGPKIADAVATNPTMQRMESDSKKVVRSEPVRPCRTPSAAALCRYRDR